MKTMQWGGKCREHAVCSGAEDYVSRRTYLTGLFCSRGSQMGLSQWNTELRTPQYPPLSISEALNFSLSATVEEAYRMTEDLFSPNVDCNYILPPWAMTWPGGQLTGIGRNGCYMNNIRRYERVFLEAFPDHHEASDLAPFTSQLRFVNVVPLESLQHTSKLKSTLTALMSQVDSRRGGNAPLLSEQMATFHSNNGIHRNASDILAGANHFEPTMSDSKCLAQVFSVDSAELGAVTGLELDWMSPVKSAQ